MVNYTLSKTSRLAAILFQWYNKITIYLTMDGKFDKLAYRDFRKLQNEVRHLALLVAMSGKGLV